MYKWLLASILYCILALSGCALFGSSEAEILDFLIDGVVGDVIIDPQGKTVAVNVKPLDLSAVSPEVRVSAGAELTSSPTLQDGTPVLYTVTAQDGTSQNWQITATVLYGMSFKNHGVEKLHLFGWTNSDNPVEAAELGNGIPFGEMIISDELTAIQIYACEKVHDLGSGGDYSEPYETCHFAMVGDSPGTYTSPTGVHPASFFFVLVKEADPVFHGINRPEDTVTVTIDQLPPVGSGITGTFSGTFSNPEDENDIYVITDGYYKVLRLVDKDFT